VTKMTERSKISPSRALAQVDGDVSRVNLAALIDLADEAIYDDFHRLLADTPYTDVRPTHGCAFRFLREDGMRLTELASLAGLTKQSVGEIVDDLADLGYVERYPDPTDKRAKLLRLTGKGKQAQNVGFALFDRLEDEWAEAFGADRIAAFRSLLEDIALAKSPAAVPELSHPEPAPVP
jgi:DNA-binding MarR family transcriptional regulator